MTWEFAELRIGSSPSQEADKTWRWEYVAGFFLGSASRVARWTSGSPENQEVTFGEAVVDWIADSNNLPPYDTHGAPLTVIAAQGWEMVSVIPTRMVMSPVSFGSWNTMQSTRFDTTYWFKRPFQPAQQLEELR